MIEPAAVLVFIFFSFNNAVNILKVCPNINVVDFVLVDAKVREIRDVRKDKIKEDVPTKELILKNFLFFSGISFIKKNNLLFFLKVGGLALYREV